MNDDSTALRRSTTAGTPGGTPEEWTLFMATAMVGRIDEE